MKLFFCKEFGYQTQRRIKQYVNSAMHIVYNTQIFDKICRVQLRLQTMSCVMGIKCLFPALSYQKISFSTARIDNLITTSVLSTL